MRTEKEKMLAGDLYQWSKELAQDQKNCRKLLRLYNQTREDEEELRNEYIHELMGKTGEKLYIEPPFYCDYGKNIEVGEGFYANFDCIILDVAQVKIGNNVLFGPRVSIFTAAHPLDAEVRISGLEYAEKITIEDNVWVGGNTTINPGVKIGKNVVVGSGSVVTKDIPDNVVAAGNPCRVLREITETDKKYWEKLQAVYWQEVEETKKGEN